MKNTIYSNKKEGEKERKRRRKRMRRKDYSIYARTGTLSSSTDKGLPDIHGAFLANG